MTGKQVSNWSVHGSYNKTEKGFEYKKCSRREAEEYILSAFDNAMHQCLMANAAGRALEKVLQKHGLDPTSHQIFMEYMNALQDVLEDTEEKT